MHSVPTAELEQGRRSNLLLPLGSLVRIAEAEAEDTPAGREYGA